MTTTVLVVCRDVDHMGRVEGYFYRGWTGPGKQDPESIFRYTTMEAAAKTEPMVKFDKVLVYQPICKSALGLHMFYALVRDELPKYLKHKSGLVKII